MPESFAIAPAGLRHLWVFVPVAVILLGVAAVLLLTLNGANRGRFEFTEAGLSLRGDIYRRTVPYAALDPDGMRLVDWRSERDLEPVARTMGTGVPGYRSGWFRLRNGQKALLFVSTGHPVVHLPTHDGYALQLTPGDPRAFMAAVTRHAAVAR